jgi:glycosyltransferase involved in cell wall biosynthesis
VLAGQAALRRCLSLRDQGFVPDLCVVHPGWGDALFLRDAFPETRILAYCEYYWRDTGADVGFDADSTLDLDARCALRMRNAALLVSLESADQGLAPTEWQRDLHPQALLPRIEVVHDGIDTARVCPNPAARFTTPNGRVLRQGDEVVTYVARGLEPQRGFPALMRALPALLQARPQAEIVICGDEAPSYGPPPANAPTWRAALLAEVGNLPDRVHFTGALGYDAYLALLQVSALHLYLSVPFVLSWSVTEAMAAGCLVLGSDTAPVREFITDGANGFLIDARDPTAIAHRAAELLAQRTELAALRQAARATIAARCALQPCLAAQAALIDVVLAR